MTHGDLALATAKEIREGKEPSRTIDIAIVGAGPAGLVVAQAAFEAGLEFLLLERENLAANWRKYPGDMTLLSTREETELPGFGLGVGKAFITRQDAIDYFVSYARNLGLDRYVVPRLAVDRVDGESGRFVLHGRHALTGASRTVRARVIALAIGAHAVPQPLGVPGETLPSVHRWFGAGADHVGENVAVVGGGNSAVEAALDLATHGAASVTMLVRAPALRFYRETGDLADIREPSEARLRALLKEDPERSRFRLVFEASVVRIEPTHVLYRTAAGEHEALADHVYALTGYGFDSPFCRALGLPLAQDGPRLSEDRETGRPGVYVAGSSRFIQRFREDGRAIVAHALLHHLPSRRDAW